MALPVEAARLEFWRFDTEKNQLIFTTDDNIQPTAQLLSNPTRLVIDMPGTTLSSPESLSYDGAIKAVRLGALDAETTRLVVEYHAGYTIDPNQVQVRGESSRQWTVQLPEATEIVASRVAQLQNSRLGTSEPENSGVGENEQANAPANAQDRNRVSNRPVQGARTRIQGVTATADGFFIRTLGDQANIEVLREEKNGQRTITLAIDQAAVALGVTSARLPLNRYSIEGWQVDQVSANPARAEITLVLGEESPDWDIAVNDGGIVVLPKDVSISSIPDVGGNAAREASARVVSEARQPAANRQETAGELPRLPNGRFTVVIDPGHGGRDPGAVGINGLQEKQVVNDIAPRVAAILRQQGANVVMTRDSDIEVDLQPRVQTAERVNASIFVSIHANAISMSRPDVNGLETFYASDAGRRLADTVHATVLRAMRMRDRRVRAARFYVIRQTSMPAILIETGFVTGAEDAPNLANPDWREQMAEAIAEGILLHLQRGL
ncbi:MAG: N-acetylmuramoyl-L-alanine amidase [Phormidesmis priestleyi Ana]|uniref:N-acetylmuramoyl-L-alanine amidase n=1 Tax=Phormidesmis priestleyi Ana TaxID=1666911 RepID=A0A0P7ZR23_9CYAN|nr:MAG: N-acetylmuramoyl-L-alanine amidase [Phormidesmis priestleyi Ana]